MQATSLALYDNAKISTALHSELLRNTGKGLVEIDSSLIGGTQAANGVATIVHAPGKEPENLAHGGLGGGILRALIVSHVERHARPHPPPKQSVMQSLRDSSALGQALLKAAIEWDRKNSNTP